MPVTPLSRGRRSRGQSLVEFALLLPVFAMLTLGVLDATRIFAAHIAVSNAAREGAVFAGRAQNYLLWCRDPSDSGEADPYMTTSVSCPTGAASGNYAGDPGNIAYRVAAQTMGLDRSRVTLDPARCGIGSSAPTATCVAGGSTKYVLVRVSYRFDMLTPLISQLWGGSVTLSASATARVNDQ